MDFSDLCKDRSHEAVHFDALGYMKCDVDKKYVYSDGRTVTFADPKDQQHYEQTKRRLAVFRKSWA
jgi:hypothetical protein